MLNTNTLIMLFGIPTLIIIAVIIFTIKQYNETPKSRIKYVNEPIFYVCTEEEEKKAKKAKKAKRRKR